ncbi:D-alanyl-D-alanine carboxypeptidase [Streptomyces sp. YS415]|uniref:D-alanyl-D-alanine carboxypeptidase n=1 Tax=Streptomyces sp. YS415 TaxID=2944806 RepID=UPI002020C0A9|nr:D-alanyl-D-alanine carboxypeptidase [Streptomyces sp. YS415]MCL7425312.1 D-alanyl-D-alanine carboxypeptidase [Streptomyces sp. YS415]
MAGESPDSSKQRESSEEPTSGSAGPVPEARNESTDPRLAMARAAVDTATRVLSARELANARKSAPDPETPDAKTGDDRLRAAVAAWVATDTEGPAGAKGTAEAPGTTEEPTEAPGTAGASAEAPDAAQETAGTAEESGEAATDADGEAEEAAQAASKTPEAQPKSGSAEAAPEDDTPERDAPAATEEDAPEASTDSESSTPAPEPGTDAKTATDAKPGAEPDAEPDGPEDAPADAKPTPDAEQQPADAQSDTEDAPVAGKADPRDTPAAPGAEDSPVAGKSDPQDTPAAPEAEDASVAGKADPRDTAAAAAADGEVAPPGPPAGDDESRTGGAGGKQDAAAGKPAQPDTGKGGAAAGVDQATTAFRAVQPQPRPRPAVDQPTGKFVALKPDLPAKSEVTTAVPQVGPERTTQQPLPPKPPLDLLAELTNTPPPPETPVRTLVRRVKIWTPLVLLLIVVFAIVQAVRPLPTPTLDLTAESTYTFDGSRVEIPWPADGQAALDVQGIGSFGSSGDQKPVPIASVAKVMTAYVILRDHPLKSGAEGPKIEIDQAAEEQSDAGQESTVDVFAGDSITQREALESILIASANNVARLLARWDAGSEKGFVEKMNAAAEDLGMTNTTYTDPSGLNNTTVSTAVDQVKLAKAAMEFPAFREVSAMMSYDDYKGQNHGNWNQLVGKSNVVGIKTGTTTSALGNLVFAAKQDVGGEMRTIVGAVVRQPDTGGGILAAALDSGDRLIRAAQGALESATLLKKGDVVGYVDDGLGGRTPVVATKDVKAAGWAGLKVELDFKADAVPHEAKAGTKVGMLTVGDGGTAGAVQVPVALKTDLAEPAFTDRLTRIG